MSQKRKIYIAMLIGLLIGNGFLLSSWLLRPKKAQAQCMRYWLTSGATSATTVCSGGARISVSVCYPGYGPYNIGRRYVGLCVGS